MAPVDPPTGPPSAVLLSSRRRSALRRPALAVAIAALATTSVVVPGARPAAAQAHPVLVDVRTEPELADPGDDVVVSVRLQGCPPGAAVVEVYLETDDGAARTAELMARQPARVSLLWSLSATVSLPDAIEGWYGIRVLCGTFRPPREPMANTRFAVGAKPTKVAGLSAAEVAAGSTIRVAGDGCPGEQVQIDLVPSADVVDPFETDLTVPVDADGRWSGDLPIPAGQRAQRARVRARCLVTNVYGRTVTIDYAQRMTFLVTEP